jgi:hypothetical protein
VHLLALGLEFLRGALLTLTGAAVGMWIGAALDPESWPLSRLPTLGVLALGAAIPAGGLVRGLGGWRRRGFLFGLGTLGFLAGSLFL